MAKQATGPKKKTTISLSSFCFSILIKHQANDRIRLRNMYGNDWVKISQSVGRTPQACKDRMRHVVRREHAPAANVKRKTATATSFRNARHQRTLEGEMDDHMLIMPHVETGEDGMPLGVEMPVYEDEHYWTNLDDHRLVTRLWHYVQKVEVHNENEVGWDDLKDPYWGDRFSGEELKKRWIDLVKARADHGIYNQSFDGE